MAATTRHDAGQQWFRLTLRLLIAGAFGISAYLAWAALMGEHVAGCGPESGCDRVLQSRWSSWLGIPVSVFALGTYAAAFLATFGLARRDTPARQRQAWGILVLCAAAILGAVVWFVGVQAFVLGAFCPYCMAAHGLGATAAVWILARAPVCDPDDKPWKLEKLVFIRPRAARRLYLVAGVAVVILVFGQVLHRPKTFAVRSLGTAGGSTSSISSAASGQVAVASRPLPPGSARRLALYGGAVELDLAELPLVGEPGAPVVMVSLHDYGCHHCRIMHHHLAQVRRQWSNQVAIVNLVMPLDPKCNYTVKRTHPDHVNSCEYARTALAVWRAAPAAMEHFDDWIFTSERPPPPAEVTAYAAQLVGTNALQQALRDPWIDRQLLKNIHIYATNYLHYHQGSMPQLIIGSNVVVGALGSPADLDSLLAKQPGVRLALPTK